MTLSEVLLLLTLLCSIAYGAFDITWKISHDDMMTRIRKTKKTDRHLLPQVHRSIFFVHVR